MKKYIFLILLFLILFSQVRSQNGKIIEQTVYNIADSTVQKWEKRYPTARIFLESTNLYHITYLSDGLKVKGYLALPKKSGKFPCIIYNRGGNQEFAAITDNAFAMYIIMSNLGRVDSNAYIIIASQYRGNAGGEGKEEFGGKDVNDVLNLIPLLERLPQADTSRIGMFGWSRGGMMTYLALAKTNKIKAAVIGSGLADLIKSLYTRPDFDSLWEAMIPDYRLHKIELLKQRSATYFADKICKTTPILILQGSADWRVPSDQVLDLTNKFYQYKQPFRFVFYEGGDHSLLDFRNDYSIQIENWFNTYLRNKKPWPSLEPHGY